MKRFFALVVLGICLSSNLSKTVERIHSEYLSPTHIVCDPETERAYVSLSTAKKIAVINLSSRILDGFIELPFNPEGLALDGTLEMLYITEKKPEGLLHVYSLSEEKCLRCIKLQHSPGDVKVVPNNKMVFVANRFSNSVSVVDRNNTRTVRHIRVQREPVALDISPNGDLVAVANHLPSGAATDTLVSAEVTLLDGHSLDVLYNVKLLHGSHSLRDIMFSKDGRYLYVTHILSRNQVPTTQLDHGWMNTNVLSIVDVQTGKHYNTVLLDDFDRGAANPAGMGLSAYGDQLYIAISGAHELCIIDLQAMHSRLQATSDREKFENIPNDFRFLNGIRKRIPLQGVSPASIGVLGEKVLVSPYFSSALDLVENPAEDVTSIVIDLGEEPAINEERRGAMKFADANLCFQQWQSCVSCHPDARSDGLNWDLLNDGVGNPKNTKSMLYAHQTPPAMVTGIRENAAVAVRAGIKHIQFVERPEADAADIDAYLAALRPVLSPFLDGNRLSVKARKGRAIFVQAGCVSCHSGMYFTDGKKYDVGTGTDRDRGTFFDTPSLAEVWRTAPYLYDGRARSIKEVITMYNRNDRHGSTSNLSEKEVHQLEAYVLSL